MNVVRLAVSAGSLTLAVGGGLVLAGAPVAHAEDCTGLLGCTTKNVGDTVEKVGKGDLEGTVKQTGKTVGDTVDGVGKTVDGVTGGSGGGGEPKPPPSSGGGSGNGGGSGGGGGDSGGGGNGSPGNGGGNGGGKPKPPEDEQAKPSRGDEGGGVAGSGHDSSVLAHLQKWQSLDGALGSASAQAPATEREIPPPQVAAPPETDEEPRQQEPPVRYLTSTPAAEARTPAGRQQQPLPAGTVFAATALAGTAGVAVLSVYQHRRQRRRTR